MKRTIRNKAGGQWLAGFLCAGLMDVPIFVVSRVSLSGSESKWVVSPA